MSAEKESINLPKCSPDELMVLGNKAKETGDVEKAIKYYEMAGKYSEETKDYKTALEAYNSAAELGCTDAMVCLGDLYNEGFACRRNPEWSLDLYRKAAYAGNADGMYGVAVAYGCGYGVDVDGEKALMWYEKAAEAGSYKAMMYLANSFMKADDGLGVLKENEIFVGNAVINRPVDLDKALYWYKKAVEAVEGYGDKDLLADTYRKVSDRINEYIQSLKIKTFADECIKKRRALLTEITDE